MVIPHNLLILEKTLEFQGNGSSETHTLPWNIESDLSIVAFDKVPMAFCSFLCKMGRDRGIGEVGVWDHQVKPKMAPAPYLPKNDCPFCYFFGGWG